MQNFHRISVEPNYVQNENGNQLSLFNLSHVDKTNENEGKNKNATFINNLKSRSFIKLFPSLMIITLITMVLMTIYETAKQLLNPEISIWESHMITITFASIIAPVGGYFALRKIEKLRAKAVSELEAKQRFEVKLTELNTNLENIVDKRTVELSKMNESLKEEIKARVKIDKALRESERRYKYLFMESPVGIFYFDRNYCLVEASEKLLSIFQLEKTDIIGFNELNAVDKSLIPAMRKALNGEEGFYEGIYITTKSNITKHIAMRITPFFDDKKNITGGMAIVEDITQRKAAEYELIEAKNKAVQSDRLKSEFLAMVSHEIRTPLNVLLSFSNLIKEDVQNKLDESLNGSFDIMKNAGERIIRTVDSMIHMSELNTGNYEFLAEKICLSEFIETYVYSEFLKSAKDKNLKLKLAVSAPDCCITADHYSLLQIFTHLVDNAIKFTFEGEITISIFNTVEGKLAVEISDTGLGIDENFIPHLFEPFRQEEQGYTRKFEGNGLGLALVKKYCDLNNAVVDVKSVKHKGSDFRVLFPVAG